mgnify:CR=1 FL=1
MGPPGSGRALARVSARRRAFSASGVRKGDHILDPRTGLAIRGRAGAWVAVAREDGASAAAVADALSTAFMVMAPGQVERFCVRRADTAALLFARPVDPRGGPDQVYRFGARFCGIL